MILLFQLQYLYKSDIVLQMSSIIYLNNEFLGEEHASINTNDRGLLLADGLFETLLCKNGKPIEFNAHWERLQKGVKHLTINSPQTAEQTQQIIETLLQKNEHDKNLAAIRITLTRGVGARGLTPNNLQTPTFLITSSFYEHSDKPLKIMISSYVKNDLSPLCAFKTLAYTDHVAAKIEAQQNKYDDALLLNTRGNICCATSGNFFMLKDGVLYTPALSEGPLPGVTRQRVIETTTMPCVESIITPDMALDADATFITNSLIGARPVSQLNQVNFLPNYPASEIYNPLF